ncbi:putative DNA-binding domain protein [Mycobacterium xenopi 4042]|uniref:Putative DNA-binding domain protein n=1 Tax=Mycobacterium xenopi 4042 TaxID=1299334 RepID=X8AH95_MYCXE|nr:putative DNA-binding domain protein [Mycobacterium xenopi 4042]
MLLETLSAAPVPELRSGGLGVREVKRLAKATGIDDARLGLILEVAAAAGLIASGMPSPPPEDGDGPTGRQPWPPTGSRKPRPPSGGICWPAPGWTCRPVPR